MGPLTLHKFGGTSLGSASRIASAAGIVRKASRRERVVVVASATAGTTNRLLEAAEEARKGRSASWKALVEEIRQRHLALCASLESSHDPRREPAREPSKSPGRPRDSGGGRRLDARGEIVRLVSELYSLLSGIDLLRELSDRSRDAVASVGERLCVPIFAEAIRSTGLPARPIDARKIIHTNDRHGRAAADLPATRLAARKALLPLVAKGFAPVVTGFIGSGPGGETTTLGRSGSDTTSAILAAALGAKRIVIWTDVDGVLTADPRLVRRARLLPRLTYREAAELTYFGAKVLHFPAMIPAIAEKIPILIRNSFRTAVPGSRIDAKGSGRTTGIAAVTAMRALALISLDGKGIVGVPGIAARVFSAVARERVSVLMFSQASSEQNICLVVPEEDRAPSLRALRDEFAPEIALSKLDGVRAHGPVAAVAAVGEGMRGTPGIAARVFSAVARAGINVEAIAQGSSEVNISFVVEDGEAARAVEAVHRLCLEKAR